MLERLVQAMEQVRHDCPHILGAVLATPEGLVLADCGSLHGDAWAAVASGLVDHLDQDLALLLRTACRDALLWTPEALWAAGRLAGRHVVLAQASTTCSVGSLRLALGRLRRDLEPHLAPA